MSSTYPERLVSNHSVLRWSSSKFDVVDLVVDTRFSNVTWMNRTPGGVDSWSPISEEHKTKIRVFFDLPVLNEVEDDEGAQDVETTGDGV